MPARTGAAYLQGLREQEREVWLGGERVKDVTAHPGLAHGAQAVAALYDMQHDPAHRDILTYRSPTSGQPVGTAFMAPRTHADLVKRRKAFQLWAEATLGLISVEQNNIIKIFSVAAVLFLPPTLIASIYGMNFHLLPDMPGKYGNFFFSLALMLGSMVLTYLLFRRKGWL